MTTDIEPRPEAEAGAGAGADTGDVEDHDRGLAFDLPRLLDRRSALAMLAGGGLATLVAACGGGDDSSDHASGGTTTSAEDPASAAGSGELTEIPDETAGPYPGDGSNGPNVLAESGVVRSDIRDSFGDLSGTAEGIETTLTLTVVDLNNGAAPKSGAAIYLWHCTNDGNYSLYTEEDQNYLRGVQETDDNGQVTFTTIFPGCYPGRWPHMHFEVYDSLDAATSAGSKLKTSQLALPEDVCAAAYATDGYEASVENLSRTSLQQDMVFSDGWSAELASFTGDPEAGYTATLTIAI
jgi:protocatechuate 3,4-dioxygenase beta subunit